MLHHLVSSAGWKGKIRRKATATGTQWFFRGFLANEFGNYDGVYLVALTNMCFRFEKLCVCHLDVDDSSYAPQSILVGGFNPSEKYESQLGILFPIYGKIKNIPNHQPVLVESWKGLCDYVTSPTSPTDSPVKSPVFRFVKPPTGGMAYGSMDHLSGMLCLGMGKAALYHYIIYFVPNAYSPQSFYIKK